MTQETRAVYLRGLDPETYKWLKVRAAQHERSMQAELRAMILEIKQADESSDNSLGAAFRSVLKGTGGFDELEIPSRSEMPERTVDFSE
jgi:plasmid stability protein